MEKPFLDECPKYIFSFFQLPDLKNDILGVGKVAPAYQVIKNLKNLKMDHLVLYSIPVTVLLNTCTRYNNKDLLEISCKNKVLISKVLAHEIRGTRFWDTQQRLRNVQKSVMHVQRCFFAN